MKVKDKNTFGEAYTIKGTYKKDDGFYTSFDRVVVVKVKHGVNEKNNHKKAEEQFINENKHLKDLKIHSVTYV